MKVDKEDIFSDNLLSAQNQDPRQEDLLSDTTYIPPTGLTLDQAYEKVGAFGKFNVMFIIPVIALYTFGQVIYLATPMMKLEPEFKCLDPAT